MFIRATKVNILKNFAKVIELLLLAVSFFVAIQQEEYLFSLKYYTKFISLRLTLNNFILGLFILVVWHTFLKLARAYDFKKMRSFTEDIGMVLKITSFCTMSMLLLNYLYPISFVSLSFLERFWIGSTFCLVLFRFIIVSTHKLIYLTRKDTTFVLIAGTGNKAISFANKIMANSQSGYKLKGFVDTKWESITSHESLPEIVADFNSLATYLRDNIVDEIIIYLPVKTFYEQIDKIIAAAEEQGIIVRYSVNFFDYKVSYTMIDQIENEPHLTHYTGKMFNGVIILKEMMDFVTALILVLILSPLFLFVAIAIKLLSRGPVFFIQSRVGKNKRLFNLIKFRTMVVNAEEKLNEIEHLNDRKGQAVFKIKNDPRVTNIGKILRKLSIDELPQLFNVLTGDMSLVGPRPLPVRDYKGFDRDWQRRRFSVKPGITCIWQVSGRDNVSFEEWMRMDMEYIDNWSILLDFKIVLKTIPAVLFGSGAS